MKVSKNLLILHITVLVWGFTGILGALISISAIQLVWYRVLIAFLSLLIYFKATGKSLAIYRNDLLKFICVGGLVGLHWFLFFWSIKLSTVSVTLVCMSSLTLFTALIEPLFTKEKIAPLDLAIGLVIMSGIYLIFKFETQYIAGIITGLGAALVGSLFSILNSRMVKTSEATVISLYEMLGAWLWLSLYLLFTGGFDTSMHIDFRDFTYLMLLGTICTSIAYVAGISVMRELSAFRVALITNLEPVYGILLAWIIFGKKEEMSLGFYLGAGIVLAAVFLYPYFKARGSGLRKP